MSRELDFDLVIVGGGHAGIEAASAACRMGLSVSMVTLDVSRIGEMSCNPAIGGLAKGHLVKEIDALGGEMGRLADQSGIQFKVLNRSKGPAVRATRVQCDRRLYRLAAQSCVSRLPNLTIIEDSLIGLDVAGDRVAGARLLGAGAVSCRAIVICSGTFLEGLIHIGSRREHAGRIGEPPARGLSAHMRALGFRTGRLKTGTPPRIDGDSVDWSWAKPQPGDHPMRPFSSCTKEIELPQLLCHLIRTSPATHALIRDRIGDSPIYNGRITAVGPRYCPSIEDKVMRFPDKDHHQIFLEPEGLDTNEIYVNGFSSSLPSEVQRDALRTIRGLERVELNRPGYAVEYDFFPPDQVGPSLETKRVRGLFLAGQINGTSGYEEAAAQGLMAGINAALAERRQAPLIIERCRGYIGVLIDDLCTLAPEEPYRMFTSRAEYRLLLREDNAEDRLIQMGVDIGLVEPQRLIEFKRERDQADHIKKMFHVKHPDRIGTRPEYADHAGRTVAQLLRFPGIAWEDVLQLDSAWSEMAPKFAEKVAIEIRYAGYLQRQSRDVERLAAMDKESVPSGFDFGTVRGMKKEAVQKLTRIRPATLGQASRIAGVTPGDLALLYVHVRRFRAQRAA